MTAKSTKPSHLRMGVVLALKTEAEQHTVMAARARLDLFCTALGKALGTTVTPHGFEDYSAVLDAMNEDEVDFAWLPPLMALRSASQGRTIPVAYPVRSGSVMYHAALFARAGSPMSTPHDLQGARAAWVDPQSASGYLVIRAWLRSQSVNLKRAFGEEHFAGTHRAVAENVRNGAADVGSTYVHLAEDNQTVRSAGWGTADVKILGMVGPIPADVLAARVSLPAAEIRALRDVLVAQEGQDFRHAAKVLFDGEGFVAAETEHLGGLTDLFQHLDGLGTRPYSISPPAD